MATPRQLEGVVVTGDAIKDTLDMAAPTASRLGISVRETPATLDSVDAETMQARGFHSVEEAGDSLPGVTSGGSPSIPSGFSMRGFTDGQIMVLRDGLNLGPSGMTYRPQNAFNLSAIEVLKGPGSVLYGQGSIGGTVNVLTKKPNFQADSLDLLASYGTFRTSQLGIGGNRIVSDSLAARLDVSRNGSQGYIDRTPSDATNLTASLLWKASSNLDVRASIDILHDHPVDYWGAPLVPASFGRQALGGVVQSTQGLVLDARMRSVNYNVSDNQFTSTQYIPRLTVDWRVSPDLVLTNEIYDFYANRKWRNAETYSFNPSTGLIDRDRFFVFHDQHLFGDQLSAAMHGYLADLPNRFVVGLDYSNLDFTRTRGFPNGDSVDPFNPAPGTFGLPVPRRSPTRWVNTALFAEDAVDLTPALKAVVGARVESFRLDRQNYGVNGSFQASSSFTRDFNPANARLGLIYQLTPDISPYLQVSTGQDPVGSNIFLVNASQNFDLSTSEQVEAGVKASFDNHRGEFTVAVYDIERRNILTQTSADTVSNVGSQKSQGLELSTSYRSSSHWQISGNLAYTDARYGNFIDNNNGANASGTAPPNVPKWTGNLFANVSGLGGVQLTAGGAVRYVGERSGSTAGTLFLSQYTLVDFFATYRLDARWSLTGRINNAFDRAYAQWADTDYPNQVLLGAPRNYEVSVVGRF